MVNSLGLDVTIVEQTERAEVQYRFGTGVTGNSSDYQNKGLRCWSITTSVDNRGMWVRDMARESVYNRSVGV